MAANDSPHTLEWEVVRAANGELYRRSIQAYVMNEKGFFLAFQPCGNSNGNFRQPIQGGIDRGETPLDALTREMKEEAGLVLGRDVHVIAEVLPLSAALVSSATAEDEEGGDSQGDTAGNATHAVTERHNSKDEVLDETRATYRYKSKTWRKAGVSGQELYPFLLYANESVIRRVNLKPASKDVRREFSRVFWEPLSSFAEHVAPAKRDPMLHIVPAVYHAAMQYRKEQGQPRLLPDADVITTTAYFQSRLTENHLALDGETGLLTKAQL